MKTLQDLVKKLETYVECEGTKFTIDDAREALKVLEKCEDYSQYTTNLVFANIKPSEDYEELALQFNASQSLRKVQARTIFLNNKKIVELVREKNQVDADAVSALRDMNDKLITRVLELEDKS